jgi:hypothetical protein
MLEVTCSNSIAVTGSDALSDPALRALNIASIAARSVFGPTGAYVFAIQVAMNSVTGLPVAVNRWAISNDHSGNITIYVASPTGPVITSDLQGISNAIEKYARPDGVTVLPGAPGFPSQPASAVAVPYNPAITVYVLAPVGTTAATLQTTINAALDAWFKGASNPIGGLVASDDTEVDFDGIFESGVSGVIAQAVASVPGCVLLATRFSGVSDLPLVTGEVAANAITSLTVNIQSMS